MVDFPNESGPTRNQRGSLRQVNQTLLGQNEILIDTQSRVQTTNDILRQNLEEQTNMLSMKRLEDAEANREKRKEQGQSFFGGLGRSVGAGAGAAAGGIQGMFRNMAALLTPAALMALPAILANTLLTRGVPALAVGVFADEIADFMLGDEATNEMKSQVAQGIQGAAVGSLLGRRFAVIGAAAGFIINNEVKAQLLQLGQSVSSLLGEDVRDLEGLKNLALDIGNWIRTNLVQGLEGINTLLRGDLMEFATGGKVLETLGLIGGLALLFSPSGAIGLAVSAAKVSLGTLAAGITSLTGLTLGSVAAAAAVGGLAYTATKYLLEETDIGRSFANMIGDTAASVAGALGIETEAQRQANRQSLRIGGYIGTDEETEARELMNRSISAINRNPQFSLEDKETKLDALGQAVQLGDIDLLRRFANDTESQLQSDMSAISGSTFDESFSPSPTLPASVLQQDNESKSPIAVNNVDASTNTTNNNVSTSAIVAPLPNPAERDPYSNLLGAR